MKITYDIELYNDMIGVKGTVVRVASSDGGAQNDMAFLLKTDLSEEDGALSLNAAKALIETISRMTKYDVNDLIPKKTGRRKAENA